ncbi:MAG: phosphomethylpyrimidine synthase ThiC, partial [Candidatus Scalindua sp.]|nr:phosphomethylpyrimidine synthase ThiC [Candidatus Scalindua sp.]
MTQIKQARLNKITPEMKQVAQLEDCDVETLRSNIAAGKVVIPRNRKHSLKKICGIGKGLRTKVNANIGTSADY